MKIVTDIAWKQVDGVYVLHKEVRELKVQTTLMGTITDAWLGEPTWEVILAPDEVYKRA